MDKQVINTLLQYIATPWVMLLIASFVCMLFILLLVLYWRKTRDVRLLKKLIKKHSQACEQDVVISDGLDGFLFTDYLLLMQGKIIAMKVLNKRGYIFGGEKIDEWTCVENNKTEKFSNPLVPMQLFAQELKHALNFTAVEAYVLFGNQSIFAKGVPQGVVSLDNLEEKFILKQNSEKEGETAEHAWQKALMLSRDCRANAMTEQTAI